MCRSVCSRSTKGARSWTLDAAITHTGTVLLSRTRYGVDSYKSVLMASCRPQVWNLDTCKCTGTVLASGKPVCRLELAGGRLYAATGRRVLVWAMPCLVPIASVAVSREAGAVCSLCVGPRV